MRSKVIVVSLLAVLTVQAWSQRATTADTGRAALEELRCFRLIQVLQITREHAPAIIEILADVSKLQTSYATWASEQWKTSGQQVLAVTQAWATGQSAGDQEAAVFILFQQYLQQRAALRETAEKAADTVLATLKVGPEVAEDRHTAEDRQIAERRFWGARNAAELVLSSAESLRLLMPDDYDLVRLSEAQKVAQALSGGPQAPPPQLIDVILRTFDDLVQVAPAILVNGRQQILADIARRLQIDLSAVIVPAVTWDELVSCVESSYFLAALQALAGTEVSAVTLAPREFEAAMNQVALVVFFHDLQLGPQQADAVWEIVGQTQRAVDARDRLLLQHSAAATTLVAKVREAVRSGQPLDAASADAIQALLDTIQEADGKLKVTLTLQISQVRRILDPGQRQLVDWVPPGEVMRLMPPERRAEELREQAAMIDGALAFMNRIKFSTATDYKARKVQLSQNFVRQYFRENTPAFDRALDFTLQVVTDARFVSREDWENGADLEYATNLLRGLGLLETPGVPEPTGQELYNWQDLYELLTGAAEARLRAAGGNQ